jgi:uncharacterized phage protein (TIGR02218 family)
MSVTLSAAAARHFGVTNADSLSFDAAGGDLLVVVLGWSYAEYVIADPALIPSVTYGGVAVQPIAAPRAANIDAGAVAVYVLDGPASGANALAYSSSVYVGAVQVAVFALSGTSGRLGVRAAAFNAGSSTSVMLVDTSPASLLIGAGHRFFAADNAISAAGWTEQATDAGANGRVLAYTAGGGSDQALTLTSTFANLFAVAIEVQASAGATETITVQGAEVLVIGGIDQTQVPGDFQSVPGVGGPSEGEGEATVPSCDLLVIGVTYTHSDPPPEITVGGRPARYIDFPAFTEPEVGKVRLAVIANPPAGTQPVIVSALDRFVGQVLLHMVALDGVSGRMGAFAAFYSSQAGGTRVLENTLRSSLCLAMLTMNWQVTPTESVAAPWTLEAQATGDYVQGWIWSAPGGTAVPITWTRGGGFGHQVFLMLEFEAASTQMPDVTAAIAMEAVPTVMSGLTGDTFLPPPNGQRIGIYWETFFDRPTRPSPVPSDFKVFNLLPPTVDLLMIGFAIPNCTYVDLDSSIYETTGVPIYYPARVLKDLVAALKARNPRLKVLLSIQQSRAEPYTYLPEAYYVGWPSWHLLTDEEMDACKLFCDDVGLDGVDIDYELFSAVDDLEHHCSDDADGNRVCWTDAELVEVVTRYRAKFPRPDYILSIAAPHVGCFGEGPFKRARPGGWNAGYNLALAKNPATANALDIIFAMTYDATFLYDPRLGFDSFKYYFPTADVFIGLRVGTPEWGDTGAESGPRRSLYDFMDYLNHVCQVNGAGAFVYALLWDVEFPSAATFSPTGEYGPEYPDAQMTLAFAAARFGTGTDLTRSGLMLAWCVEIHRQDGRSFYFVLRDKSLVANGRVYKAAGGVQASSQVAEDGTEAGSAEALGFLSSALITDDDIRAGLYDNAEIVAFAVDWAPEVDGNPVVGEIGKTRYLLQKLTPSDDGTWRAEMVDDLNRLSRQVGRQYTRTCRHDLGDAKCAVDLAPFTQAVTVVTVIDARRQFTVSAGANSTDGWYSGGVARFTTGANEDLSIEVGAYLGATRDVSLGLPLPYDVAPGDALDLVAGCDRAATTCVDKFANLINFGGYPFLPGTGELAQQGGR